MIETLPIGRRLAFDAAQGRLWVVCRHCAKWNLVPFESRLESIDACERLFRDTPTRYSTDNIGLARVKEGLELVRIGPAMRPEFAGWRYGEQYRRRRRKALIAGGVGVGIVGLGTLSLGIGASGLAFSSMVGTGYGLLHMLMGSFDAAVNHTSRLALPLPNSRKRLPVDRKKLAHATISWDYGEPSLDVPITFPTDEARVLSFRGNELRSVGRKVLASMNALIGKPAEIELATSIVGHQGGDLTEWLRSRTDLQCSLSGPNFDWRYPASDAPLALGYYATPYLLLQQLGAGDRLAIELWMNEDIERQWLEGELTLLEREWRQAEELAKISDGLALPETAEEELEKRKGSAQP
ncbi:MAG: hypothetical protein SFU84_07870 [Gemmatimonadales bacterium]|nr:hypothetical protein [Gemmatimonadales bacterium]